MEHPTDQIPGGIVASQTTDIQESEQTNSSMMTISLSTTKDFNDTMATTDLNDSFEILSDDEIQSSLEVEKYPIIAIIPSENSTETETKSILSKQTDNFNAGASKEQSFKKRNNALAPQTKNGNIPDVHMQEREQDENWAADSVENMDAVNLDEDQCEQEESLDEQLIRIAKEFSEWINLRSDTITKLREIADYIGMCL